ncbi:MAG TPA: hypothetical protein VNZ45_15070 [Bacteroidia bacterium]|jgi:hypothetical protein|nr:hypothetical protein [Bacteroidia bacterium]
MNTHLKSIEIQEIVEKALELTTNQAAHIGTCPVCTARKKEYEAIFEALKQGLEVRVPETFADEVVVAIEAKNEDKIRSLNRLIYFVVCIVTAIFLFFWMFKEYSGPNAIEQTALSVSFIAFIYVAILESKPLLGREKVSLEEMTL